MLVRLGCLEIVNENTACLMTLGLARLRNSKRWGCWKVGMCRIRTIWASCAVAKCIGY